MKKDTFWFPHDCDAADDDKTMLLIDQLGLEGYGIYWLLIEKLRSRNDFKMPFSSIPTLARRYVTTAEKMKAVITQYGLFEYDDDGFFFSRSLINRMQAWIDTKEKRSIAGKIGNEARWKLKKKDELSQTDRKRIANGSQSIAIIEQNIIEDNITEHNKFNFKQSLIDIGVSNEVADDWIKVRKLKRAANTETAFNSIKKQIEKSGISANECITIAVERSWQGFKAEWVDNISTSLFDKDRYVKDKIAELDGKINSSKVIVNGVEYK